MAVKSSPAKAAPKAVAAKGKAAAAPGKPAAKAKPPSPPVKLASKAPAKAAAKPVAKAPAAKAVGKKPAGKAAPAPVAQQTVTIKHLAERFGESHTMPKKQAEGILNDIIEMLVTHLKSGDRLRINGLGILEVKNRPARMGRNPATGASIQIAASKKIAFRPSKELKGAI
jgi:DNA-binding protein HU-beta